MSAENQAGKTQFGDTLTISKSYLFGVYLGDGCCSKFTEHYNFTLLSSDRDVVERTRKIVNNLLMKSYPLKSITPNKLKLYFFKAWNRRLFEMLIIETDNKSKIPNFVMNSDSRIIAEFVAGLMDTDGYISAGKNKLGFQRYALGFVNFGKWIDQFILLLKDVGVKVGKKTLKKKYRSINEKDCYQININLRSFIERGFYFNCKRKQEVIEQYKSNVRYQKY